MAKFNLENVANCLSEDNCLPSTKIPEFAGALGVTDANFERQLTNYKCSSSTTFELISYILKIWKSKWGKEASVPKLVKVLCSISCQNAAEQLQELERASNNSSSPGSIENIFFDCLPAYLLRKFIGRNYELQKLATIFQCDRKLFVLSGLGGVGKSSIARQFAQTQRGLRHCFLFRAETLSTVEEDILLLGEKQGIQIRIKPANPLAFLLGSKRKPAIKVFRETLSLLRNKHNVPFLLILDNVSGRNEIIDSLISSMRRCEDVAICITTRLNLLYVSPDITTIPVSELTAEDAHRMVKSKLPYENDSSIHELCTTLNNFPLGIEQAVGCIHQRRMTTVAGTSYNISRFLKDFKHNSVAFLESNYDDEDKRSLSTIWNIHFKQITKSNPGKVSKMTLTVLNTLAFLDPNGVEVEVLTRLSCDNASKHKGTVKQSLELLQNFSLIRLNHEVVSIHRLVQEVTLQKQKNISKVIRVLSRRLLCFFNLPMNANILIHALRIWDRIVETKSLASVNPEIVINICNWMKQLGNHDLLVGFINKTLQTIDFSGRNMIDELKYSKATSQYILHKDRECLQTLLEVEESVRRFSTQDEGFYGWVRTRCLLLDVYLRLHMFREVIRDAEILRSRIEVRKYPDEWMRMLLCKLSVAEEMFKYPYQKSVILEIEDTWHKYFGSLTLSIPQVHEVLLKYYFEEERYPELLFYCRSVQNSNASSDYSRQRAYFWNLKLLFNNSSSFERVEIELGIAQYPLQLLQGLMDCLQHFDYNYEAMLLHEEAIKFLQSTPSQKETLLELTKSLFFAKIFNNNFIDAENIFVNMLENNFPKKDDEILMSTYSKVLQCLFKFDEAINYARKVVSIRKKHNEHSLEALKSLVYLADCHFSNGEYETAASVFEKVLVFNLKAWNNENPTWKSSHVIIQLFKCRINLGYLSKASYLGGFSKVNTRIQERFKQKSLLFRSEFREYLKLSGFYASLLEETISEIALKVNEKPVSDYVDSINHQSLVYFDLGKPKATLENVRKAISLIVPNLANNRIICRVLCIKCDVHEALENDEKALKLWSRLWKKCSDSFGHFDSITCYAKLQIFKHQMKTDNLETLPQLLTQEHMDRKNHLGVAHKSTCDILFLLAETLKKLGQDNDSVATLACAYKDIEQSLGIRTAVITGRARMFACCLVNLGNITEGLRYLLDIPDLDSVPKFEWVSIKLSIAGTYEKLGRFEEALVITREIYNIGKTLFFKGNRDHYRLSIYYARLLSLLNHHHEAIHLLDDLKQILNENAPFVTQEITAVQQNLAVVYMKLQRYSEALKLFELAYEWRRENFGDVHSFTLHVKFRIGWWYHEMREMNKAEEIYVSVLHEDRKTNKYSTQSCMTRQYYYAIFLFDLGKNEAALEILEALAPEQGRVLGYLHYKTKLTELKITEVMRSDPISK